MLNHAANNLSDSLQPGPHGRGAVRSQQEKDNRQAANDALSAIVTSLGTLQAGMSREEIAKGREILTAQYDDYAYRD